MERVDAVIAGAGLAGLAAAAALRRAGRTVAVVEGRDAPGGNLRSVREETPEGSWLLDLGPQSFGDAQAAMMSLVGEAGLHARLVPASEDAARRWIWRAGRMREVPAHPLKFLTSGVVPLGTVLRMIREPWIAPGRPQEPEETLAAFCDRRLGPGATRTLLGAVVGGIYAGDPARLGAESAFPRMVAMEREHGSLLRAAKKGHGPPQRGRLVTFRDGLAELPAALAARLGAGARFGDGASSLARDGDGWAMRTASGRSIRARAALLTAPAGRAGDLLSDLAPDAAAELRAIRYAPVSVVHVGTDASALRMPPGFGFLVPRGEGLRILGCVASSALFAGRAPPGHALLTVFVGGDADPEGAALDDDATTRAVLDDLRTATGLRAPPALFRITRWPQAIPQYEVGHARRVARIDAALAALPGLFLAGNWRGGIAMEQTAAQAADVAAAIDRHASGSAP
ncbi:MAG: Protoporphyrinogen oxidase [Planctomycetes bacterium]|nr:Protoporphyrinogen oxidase [Planctomycetota bacterium]